MIKPINSCSRQPAESIRVGQVLWTGKKAGAETYVLRLAEGLAARRPDIKTRIIFFTHAYELGDALKKKGIEFIELRCKNGYDIIGMIRFLWEIFARKYTLLHVHETTAISLLLLRVFQGVKIIYTEHSSILPVGGFRSWLYKRSIDVCDKVFYVTERQKIEYHNIGIKAKNELTLPLGIDRAVYNNQYDKRNIRNILGYTDNACIIGYVGRFSYFKRVDKIIKATAIIKQRNPNIRLLIVGFGDEISSLRALVVSEGIDQCTDFVIAPQNLIVFQQCIDFLIHPSEHESLGLSVLEAMALGKIVIINNFESAKEIVENETDGIILTDCTPKTIAGAVESLWSNPERCSRIAKNSVSTIKNKFDFDVHLNSIIEEYRKLSLVKTS